MTSGLEGGAQRDARVGLCADCAHRRIVRNTRGSTFWLCGRSREDASYPRYPRLPVLSCAGHEPVRRELAGADEPAPRGDLGGHEPAPRGDAG